MRNLHSSAKSVMAREGSANLVKNKCMHNRWGGVFLKTNVVLGDVQASGTKRDKWQQRIPPGHGGGF